RLHIKTAPPVFIRLADEMGLLLYEEPPIGWMKVTPQMEDRCLREVREMVLRDRNHPSVILWGIANEGWGGSGRLLEKLCKTARTLDPSRPILDNSGGFVTEALRFTNCGSLYPPYSKKAVSYYDGHRYAIVPVDESTYRGYQTLGEAKQFSFLSEFGYSAPEDIRRVLKCFNAKTDKQLADYRRLESSLRSMEKEFKKYGLSRIFKDYSSFSRASQKLQAEGLKRQIEAVRSNPKLSAYCLTQFADAANEMGGGMVDSWRNPKPAFRTLKQANEPLHIAIHLPVRNVYAGKRANIEAVLINDAGISGKFSLSVRSENPKHKVVFRKSLPVRVDRRILKIYSDAMSLQGREGRYTVRMDLLDGKKVLAHSDTTFFVFKAKASRIEKVILLPREKQIADFFRKKGIKFTEFKYRGTHNRPCVVVVPNLGYSPLILRHEVTITEILDKITDVLNMVYMDGCTLLLLDTKLAYHFRMPYDFREHFAGGGFSNTFHFVKKHEVFRGLPMNCLMGDEFCNIIPIVSHRIMDREPQWNDSEPPSDEDGLIESECLAGSFHASYRKSWWASNLTCKRHGKGNIIFSQFRIVDNLGKDPLADRLLCNMLEFGQKLCSGHG
ncbi:MAG: glycoside hydrolase family 2 TIM barrel-domain containing protein, partial [Planctomycetota bacterium]|nr:glycoside hydrolase family 2 TIM barrel-domain containing protein [Planctomycetota bacterium]